MKIVSLNLENFRRYEKETIDFPEGLIGIVGRNGVGKTTLVEAIGWCLYGNPAARTGKDNIKRSEATDRSECKVVVELILGADTIRVERSLRGRNSSGNSSLFLNGESKASVNGMNEVSNYITSRTGMDHVAFFTSIFAKQKELAALSNWSKAERKKIILRLLRIDKIEDVISLIRFDMKESKNILEFVQKNLRNMNDLQNELGELENQKSSVAAEITQIKASIAKLKKLLETAQQNFSNLEQKYKEHQHINKEIAELSGLINGAKKERSGVESDLTSVIESQQKLIEIKPQLVKFDEIKKEKQKLDSLQIKYTEKISLQKQYEEYGKQIANKTKENEQLAAQLKLYDGIDIELGQITQKLILLQENYGEKRDEESKTQSIIDEKTHQRDSLQQEFDEIKSLGEQSVCPKCKRQLGTHIKELSKHYTLEIQQLQNSIDSHVKKKSEMSSEIKTISDNIESEQSNEASIKKKIEQRTTLKIRLDETGKTLADLKLQQSKIAIQLENYSDIQYDKNQHLQVNAEFQRLDDVNKIAIALDEKAKNIPNLQKRIESINDSISTMNEKVSNHDKQLEIIGFSEEQYEKAKKSKSEIESNFYQQREILVRHEQYLNQTEDKIFQQKQAIKEEKEKEQIKKDAENKINSLQLLGNLMIEFKMDLISRIKPQLSSRTSELFRQMTNGRYSSIELDDDYTIMINDRGKSYPIERFSGGETDLVNLCLRIAISQELSQRAGGSRTQFIVLDEIFGSQDEERQANILRSLQNLTNQFRQILLITHIEDIRESLPYVFYIKENDNNTVTVEEEGNIYTPDKETI